MVQAGTRDSFAKVLACATEFSSRVRAEEQINRYCMVLDTRDRELKNMTMEDNDEDDARHVLRDHRHYDEFMENEPVGKRYLARMTGVPSARRRHHARLGVSRVAFLEPIGASRESHYQQR